MGTNGTNGIHNFGPTEVISNKMETTGSQEMVTMETNNGKHPNGTGYEERQGLMTSGDPSRDGDQKVGEHGKMPFVMYLLRRRLQYLPIVTFVFIVSSFFISYGISVYQGHVEPDFPYISKCISSYTAIHAPERCIFAQLVNVGAFMLAANIYIRYLQMSRALSKELINAKRRDIIVNRASLAVGWLSAFGLTMVANFQTVEMRPGHYTGAGLAFILGMVYCWMQTSLSIRYSRWTCVAISQLVNSIVLTVCLLVFAISKSIYKANEAQGNGTKFDTLRGVYLVSTISEWLTATSIVTFALTFYRDFSRISFKSPSVKIEYPELVKEDFPTRNLATEDTDNVRGQNGDVVHNV